MAKEKKEKGAVKKPFYKKWWFWVVIIVVLSAIIGNSGGKDEDKGNTPPATTAKSEESQMQAETRTEEQQTSAESEEQQTPTETKTEESQTSTETVDNVQSEDNSSEPIKLPVKAEITCRALTTLFVENVVGEKWHMTAFEVESYELDENENGTIKVLYMPPNAGNGETKVNLTIEKKDDTYTTIYALLAGLYEVDLSKVSNNYKILIN